MNWDRMEGQWKQQRGKAIQYWGRMMNDELSPILGKYEELVGRLQEKYGIAKEEANVQADDYRKIVEQLKKSNGRLMQLEKVLSKTKSAKKGVKSKTPSRRKTAKGK